MTGDIREVLQYVPLFAGRTFVIVFDEGLLPESAVAETLLDLIALQRIGVHLVVVVVGGDLGDLVDWAVESEFKAEPVSRILGEEGCWQECRSLLQRGQAAMVDGRGSRVLATRVGQLAKDLAAAKLMVLLNEYPGFGDRPSIAEGSIVAGEEHELLVMAAEICRLGVPRVHLLNGHLQGVLTAEIFSNEGVGTMVHADAYRAVRPLREEDIPELLAMMGRSVRASHLVPRTYEQVASRLHDFSLLTVDDNVVGCVAVHSYPGHELGELACLYVKESHEGRNYGGDLVKVAEGQGRAAGLKGLFALTNRAAKFFAARGYSRHEMDLLPEVRRKQLEESGRNSEVWAKWFT
ncbi:GNAT family N-acetyltransferase [Roseibacillus ishigakijimensis]|uniref:GNAT family N-acetyltransferase n=1 Tax=Roseibacillus ishigakijimensis TaxID=454146 RepID=A0A934VKW0_9BACT|nr:GNAT family N-acetyltransferase [Roseibacillus ishigakijimensis]MBK1834064.1 GNAT family N-acetyltransferase [Roseibacillus ishigakijimensis]